VNVTEGLIYFGLGRKKTSGQSAVRISLVGLGLGSSVGRVSRERCGKTARARGFRAECWRIGVEEKSEGFGMRLKRLLYRYNGVTAGERLYLYLRTEFIDSPVWEGTRDVLEVTGRYLEFVDLFQQIAAVNLAGRLVVAGVSFSNRNPVSDPLFEQAFKDFIRDTIGVTGDRFNRVYRLAEQAVAAAGQSASQGLQNRFRRWAERNHPYCYMCRAALDFAGTDQRFAYTCEHIWPQMYGGDSVEDNFLPSCGDCNWRIKQDLAGWSQVNVQAILLGVGPSIKSLKGINNIYRFAMHHRAAQRYAAMHKKTLKEAFVDIGPWTDVRVLTQHDAGDFFNLASHDPNLVLE
jgi:hypothetical protein